MSGRMRGLRFAAVIAVAAVGACAGDDDDKGWDTETKGAAPAGWEWVGEGEQQNFATADRFCRRTTVAANPRLGSDRQNLMSGSDRGVRVSEGDRRAYWGCMQSRGWKVQGG